MLELTVRSNLILKKTLRPGWSISWIGAIIYHFFDKEKTYFESGAINADGNT